MLAALVHVFPLREVLGCAKVVALIVAGKFDALSIQLIPQARVQEWNELFLSRWVIGLCPFICVEFFDARPVTDLDPWGSA